MKNIITEEGFISLLDSLYEKSLKGDEKYNFESAESLGKIFLEKYSSRKLACEKLIFNQVTKTSTSGFFASLGGIVTMPLSVPADIYITFLVEIRMIVAIAYIGGYDLNNPELKTIVYSILLGKDVKDVFIKAGLKPLGKRITLALVSKVPASLLININRKIGVMLFAKFGGKGLIQIGLAVPLIGGIIGGGINYYFTQKRGQEAIESFIMDDDVLNSDIF